MSTQKRLYIIVSSLLLASLIAGCTKTPPHVGESVTNVATKDGTEVTRVENTYLLPSGKIAGQDSALIHLESTVSRIDYKTRVLTLTSASGESVKITAGPEIRNFDQIKSGDKVTVDYLVSVAFEVRKPTAEELASQDETVGVAARAKIGEMPGAGIVQGLVKIATVEAINKEAQTVTLKSSTSSSSVEVKVKYPENLSYAKVGDTVVITAMEAFATEVNRVK